VSLVVDASVGVKWAVIEPDSHQALALLESDEELLLPDFWLHEATSVLWLRVHRCLLTAEEARKGLRFLQNAIKPVPTETMRLHTAALEIGLDIGHSTYDTLYLAFAREVGARALVLADQRFVAHVTARGDPRLVAMMLPLDIWAAGAQG
jgi:predicted nucleic acid-binding protein